MSSLATKDHIVGMLSQTAAPSAMYMKDGFSGGGHDKVKAKVIKISKIFCYSLVHIALNVYFYIHKEQRYNFS